MKINYVPRVVRVKTWERLNKENYKVKDIDGWTIYESKDEYKGDSYDFVQDMKVLCGNVYDIGSESTIQHKDGSWVIDKWMIKEELNPVDHPQYYL